MSYTSMIALRSNRTATVVRKWTGKKEILTLGGMKIPYKSNYDHYSARLPRSQQCGMVQLVASMYLVHSSACLCLEILGSLYI